MFQRLVGVVAVVLLLVVGGTALHGENQNDLRTSPRGSVTLAQPSLPAESEPPHSEANVLKPMRPRHEIRIATDTLTNGVPAEQNGDAGSTSRTQSALLLMIASAGVVAALGRLRLWAASLSAAPIR